MNRPIKFRGRDLETGEYVFGEFGQGATSGEPMIYFYDYDAQQWVGAAVEPESVAQLVGYDTDGKEVYEGDTLIDKYKTLFGDSKSTFVAELWSRAKNPANGVYKFEINQLALKEDD